MTTHTLIQGDCFKVMKKFAAESIDCVITSPPYDDLRAYNGFSVDFENIARQLFRIMKKGGVVVWIVGDSTINGSETGTSFKQALFFKKIGFNLHDTMIWEKHTIPKSHNRYEQRFEYMFIFSKGVPKTFNSIKEKKRYIDNRFKNSHRDKNGDPNKNFVPSKSKYKIAGNIWFFPTGGHNTTKNKIAFQHPAIFPEKLVADHIISWTNKEDSILDCFAGSGTVMDQALKLNRHSINIEISEDYCEIIKNRCFWQQGLRGENIFRFRKNKR